MTVLNLSVLITRFVDDYQSGWVECEFTDRDARLHKLIDKVPVFIAEILDRTSVYPQAGSVQCEVLAEWVESDGRSRASRQIVLRRLNRQTACPNSSCFELSLFRSIGAMASAQSKLHWGKAFSLRTTLKFTSPAGLPSASAVTRTS
jgi:hypothetical protein